MSKSSKAPEQQVPAADPAPEQAPAGTKLYVTRDPQTMLFDILVSGDNIRGTWGEGRKVEFAVPDEHVERFEKHYHVAVGNVVAV